MDIDQLNIDYGITDQLTFVKGNGGLPFILISNPGATALISVYAAQVLSFQPATECEDLLFLSQKSSYEEGKAIRGGIPVCWPWFGPDPKDRDRPDHGFVRNGLWAVLATTAIADNETKVTLRFQETIESKSYWRKPFILDLEISVGDTLTLKLITRNTGNKTFSITQALHAYLQVGDINQVQILGLENSHYLDKLDNSLQKHQSGAVTFLEEVDRIYTGTQNEWLINDSSFNRQIKITSTSNKTTVVWNPWEATSAKIPDLEPDDYQHFICLEAGNVDTDTVELLPGNEYSLLTNFKITRD
ncbi:D-hexose-6-phosphate mutarotase [Methylobacter psychrophilus]|uniref:D-hexose-6-phosphate mutarotase n=1 Tax=Methylobacter psychrophilus TaxID=96941 RepID=UPI0021D48E4A|nr:D-hexose-6-phosphate mutarotase [Methylobacter psychrophilus]